MKNTTAIEELDYEEDQQDQTIILEPKDHHNHAVDLSLSLKERIMYLETYYDNNGEDDVSEIINRLEMMYLFSKVKILEDYLFEISIKSSIPYNLKLICAMALCSSDSKSKRGFEALNIVCKNLKEPTPCRIEAVFTLMKNKKYEDEAQQYFFDIINDQNIDCDYRYKTILSLENKFPIKKLKNSCLEFLLNDKNMTTFRILSGQCLLKKCECTKETSHEVEKILLSFCSDIDLDVNLRSDAADVILMLGCEENKKMAQEIIRELGGRNAKTIFDNAQNVHSTEVEKSVEEIIGFLMEYPTYHIEGIPIVIETVFRKIKDHLQFDNEDKCPLSKEDRENINGAMTRVLCDRGTYSIYNCSLKKIIVQLWSYIIKHEHFETLRQRLIDQLLDSNGWCSTGYESRLANTISGFAGDLQVRISWEDQIIGNFKGRLTAKMKKQKQEIYESMLEEMTEVSSNFQKRLNFLHFIRDNMLSIREEMYEEFKEYISDTDFDLYFRKAISVFEGN